MQTREAVKVDEAVQVDEVARAAIKQPRRGRLDVLLAVAVIGTLIALMVWAVPPGSEDTSGTAAPTAGAGSAIIHDDAGNVNRNVAPAVIHDDAWNIPRDESSAVIHDDAWNMPASAGSAIIHDDAGNVNR